MVLATLDCVLSDGFVPVFEEELNREGITHQCGEPFQVRWMNSDGRILRRHHSADTYEATLTATCEKCGPQGHPTAFNYGRVSLNPWVLERFQGDPIKLLKMEVEGLWRDLKEHLRSLRRVLGASDKAVIAEGVTRMLQLRGSVLLSEVEDTFGIDHKVDRDELLRFMRGIGFVREERWRVPVTSDPHLSVLHVTDARLPRFMPITDTRMDTLLALPPEHPLAVAA